MWMPRVYNCIHRLPDYIVAVFQTAGDSAQRPPCVVGRDDIRRLCIVGAGDGVSHHPRGIYYVYVLQASGNNGAKRSRIEGQVQEWLIGRQQWRRKNHLV